MKTSKNFGVWCVVAAVVALCMGMLAGTATVSAQESVSPPFVYVPPTTQPPATVQSPAVIPPMAQPPATVQSPAVIPPVVQPPAVSLPTDLQLYQQYLSRLLQLNAEIAVLSARIGIYEAVAAANPEDPFIRYDLDIMWFQLGMLQIEQTEVRFVLTTLNP